MNFSTLKERVRLERIKTVKGINFVTQDHSNSGLNIPDGSRVVLPAGTPTWVANVLFGLKCGAKRTFFQHPKHLVAHFTYGAVFYYYIIEVVYKNVSKTMYFTLTVNCNI